MTTYYLITFKPSDLPKTATTTQFGLFELVRAPYGLRNTAQAFLTFMVEVMSGLAFTFVDFDDISVSSRRDEEHKARLRLIFERLDKNGVVLKPLKCILGVEALDFFGHRISPKTSSHWNQGYEEGLPLSNLLPKIARVYGVHQFSQALHTILRAST